MQTGAPVVPRRRTPLLALAGVLTLTAAVVIGVAVGRDSSSPPPGADRTPATAATGASASPANRPGELTSGPLMSSSPPVRVAIPALRVSAPTVPLGLAADGAMEVPENATDIGWFTRAPTPGALGPAVLAAHVNWKGEKGSFFDLARLRPGAEITVERADGSTATFTVTRVEQHPKDDFPSEAVYGSTDHAALRLITCGGDFDQARRSYRDNVIAYARLAHAHR